MLSIVITKEPVLTEWYNKYSTADVSNEPMLSKHQTDNLKEIFTFQIYHDTDPGYLQIYKKMERFEYINKHEIYSTLLNTIFTSLHHPTMTSGDNW